MPLGSVRQRIRDDVVATLSNVAAGTTYGTTLAYVSTVSDEPGEVSHPLPCAIVHAVSDEPAGARSGAVGFSTRVATWAVEAWVADLPDFPLADAVEQLYADLVRALTADPSRGGHALNTRVGPVVFLLLTGDQRLGGLELRLLVDYRTIAGSPELG